MEFEKLCKNYINIAKKFDINLEVKYIEEEIQKIISTDNKDTILLNKLAIGINEFECYLTYNLRKILLPRLVLKTNRLTIRRFRDGDEIDCFDFLSDTECCLMDGYRSFDKMDEEYASLMKMYKEQETRYMIVLNDSNKVIGVINLLNIDDRAVETMEIGYIISPKYQRNGYGYEAVSNLLELLLNDLKLDMVIAGCFEENLKSQKMLEKLNFTYEGKKRKALWVDGIGPKDTCYYYLERK